MDDSFNSGQSKIRKRIAVKANDRLIIDRAVLLEDAALVEEEELDCIMYSKLITDVKK